MGFRTGAFAKVWEVSSSNDTSTKLRISISRKNKKTNEYEQDFSGYVYFVGTANAKKASLLHEGSRIKIGDCDVTNRYDAEKKVTYTNFKVFSFEDMDGEQVEVSSDDPVPAAVDDGEVEDSRLPF